MSPRQQFDAWCAEPDEAHTAEDWHALADAFGAAIHDDEDMTRDAQLAYLDRARECRARAKARVMDARAGLP